MCFYKKINKKVNNEKNGILLKQYIHYIRNMRYLNKEMINDIRNMSDEEKMEIIILYNDIIDSIANIIN